jgi:hypothetical protein
MREAIFILLVVAVLLGLTLIRYRKQIKGMIGFARTLKELREGGGLREAAAPNPKSVALVSCSRCGTWVPANRVLKAKNQSYCSEACLKTAAPI